jgi:hypothetical protein
MNGLPRDFANEWYEKGDGITFFGVPVVNMDAAELRAREGDNKEGE